MDHDEQPGHEWKPGDLFATRSRFADFMHPERGMTGLWVVLDKETPQRVYVECIQGNADTKAVTGARGGKGGYIDKRRTRGIWPMRDGAHFDQFNLAVTDLDAALEEAKRIHGEAVEQAQAIFAEAIA